MSVVRERSVPGVITRDLSPAQPQKKSPPPYLRGGDLLPQHAQVLAVGLDVHVGRIQVLGQKRLRGGGGGGGSLAIP